MMTTGYDCPDLLNIGLFRPIFSPTDFIQIKGRGTRKHDFREQLFDESILESIKEPKKTSFKLLDFFANCEYFEKQFKYDQVRKLPKPKGEGGEEGGGGVTGGTFEHLGEDILSTIKEETIGVEGMKIDRMFYEKFEDTVRENDFIAASVEAGEWDRVIDYVNKELFDKPAEFYNLDKLRKAAAVDRRLTLREILEKIFGLIPRFKSKDELLEEEFSKFVADYKSDKWKVYIPTSERHKTCEPEDIMIGRYGPPVFQILKGKRGAYNVALIKCIPNLVRLERMWLYLFLSSARVQETIIALSGRVRQSGVNPADLDELQIPLPPLSTQQAIVAEIEAEQALVAANRELITRFEQKIQVTLARVWGEEAPSA